jgi:hypothetical protein
MTAFIRGIRIPVGTSAMPAWASISSKRAGDLASWSRIRYLTAAPASCRSMTRLRAVWVTRAAVGCAVASRMRMCRVACSMAAGTYWRCPLRVTVSRKSQAGIVSTWLRRDALHVVAARSGAGSMPASLRICHTVEAATLMPSIASTRGLYGSPRRDFVY